MLYHQSVKINCYKIFLIFWSFHWLQKQMQRPKDLYINIYIYIYIYNMILRNIALIFKSVIACQKKRLQIIKYRDCNINDFVMEMNFIRQSST